MNEVARPPIIAHFAKMLARGPAPRISTSTGFCAWGARWAFGPPRPDELDPHPGFDVDVTVTADIRALYEVWLGRALLEDVIRSRRVRLDGMSSDVHTFPLWFARSRMADTVRTALTERRVYGNGRSGSHG